MTAVADRWYSDAALAAAGAWEPVIPLPSLAHEDEHGIRCAVCTTPMELEYNRDRTKRAVYCPNIECPEYDEPIYFDPAHDDEHGPDDEQDAIVGPVFRYDAEAAEAWYSGQEDTPY